MNAPRCACVYKIIVINILRPKDLTGVLFHFQVSYRTHLEHHKSPGEGIVAVAEHEKANLIVMGTRGLDVIRRTLLGSVSDYVLRHSRIPVLVCPGGASSSDAATAE